MYRFDETLTFNQGSLDLLTFGELLVDMIADEYGENGNGYHRYFGGSPANIAMNARNLGIRSQMVAAVGNDALGQFLIRHVEDAGIDTGHVRQVDHATSMVLVTKSVGTPVPIFYREADHHLEYDKALDALVNDTKILHFSCWPVSRQPARDTLLKAIEVMHRREGLVCFDPNYHPALWEKGVDGIALVKSFIGMADIVKPSEDDAERLFGPDAPETQIRKFLDLGARFVVMTLGRHGAMVSNGVDTVKFDSMATEVVDTTGAGDAFWGGFYVGLIRGYSMGSALRAGFASSAYKLKFTGAVTALPELEKLRAMYGFEAQMREG